jgi:multiple sugar transport system permease protein
MSVLVGTLPGLVIVDLTATVPFVAWMLIGYMRNLPPIERLARIDAYSRFQTLLFLVLPLARSGVAVAAIIAFLFAWNEFTFILALVNATAANTLPTAISGFLFQAPEPANLGGLHCHHDLAAGARRLLSAAACGGDGTCRSHSLTRAG